MAGGAPWAQNPRRMRLKKSSTDAVETSEECPHRGIRWSELHKLDATGRLLPVFAWADKPPRAAEATDAFRSLAESSKALCLLRAISLHFRKFRIIANARKRRAEWEPPRRWLRPN